MAKEKKPNPAAKSLAYKAMEHRWYMIRSLMGGTEAMRQAGGDFLPEHTREPSDAYQERLNRAVLFNALELTLEFLSGRPFQKPFKFGEQVSPRMMEMMLDVDLEGNNLDRWAPMVFRDALAKGFTHVLVDTPDDNGAVVTLDDERRANVRPFWVHIPPENIIAAEAQRVNGVETLVHVRMVEQTVVRDPITYEEAVVTTIREINLVDVLGQTNIETTIWGMNEKEEWGVLSRTLAVGDTIPIFTFYTVREAFMLAKPALLDLAYLNVEHWQAYSDQIIILTVARFPILAASGVSESDLDAGITIGPYGLLTMSDPASRFYYVEHTGAAIGAGRQYILDLEDKMALYGSSLLKKRPDRETATARALDEASNLSALQRMTLGFMDFIETLMDYTGSLIGDTGTNIAELDENFGLDTGDVVDLQTLQVAYKDGVISREAFIEELKRRGVLHEDFDPIADLTRIEGDLEIATKRMLAVQPPTPEKEEDEDDDAEKPDPSEPPSGGA